MQVLDALRASVPKDEFDKDDWAALRVAIRIVYETEEQRVTLRRRRRPERTFAVSYWLDSIESGITFMSWVRDLASMADGVTHPVRLPAGLPALFRRHRLLAGRLLGPKTATERMSALLELGGIEVALLGHLWPLRIVHPPHIIRGVTAALKQASTRMGRKEQLTKAQFEELLRTAKVLGERASRETRVRVRRR